LTSAENKFEIAVIGAGVAGIATAYYLCRRYNKASVLLLDGRQPMTYTSAQSGDNYRNWWPHPVMFEFSNTSIDLMEEIAHKTSNIFNMNQSGYALATRARDIDDLISGLHKGYASSTDNEIRIHTGAFSETYPKSGITQWPGRHEGVDILSNRRLVQKCFPSFSTDIANVMHIRRAGSLSSHQLASYMLGVIRESGGQKYRAEVASIKKNLDFELELDGPDGREHISADVVVNAAGPFAKKVGAMMGIELPIENTFQQKIAFDDRNGVIPRNMPFAIDMDALELEWSSEEIDLLGEDPETRWLTQPIQGGIHCRPDGGEHGTSVKLGWAYNTEVSEPQEDLANEPRFDSQFPEIVMRGAAALNPSLAQYVKSFPSQYSHYGGYYSMTRENWPLIGPMGIEGAFITGALSGFGSMAACAAGALCADWISGGNLPAYANDLSLQRYGNRSLMREIGNTTNKGLL